MELKQTLRQRILADRKKFNEVAHLKENDSITKNLKDFLNFRVNEIADFPDKKSRLIIGLYWPVTAEPDLLKLAIDPKYSVVIPKIRGERMDYVKYEIGSSLETSISGKLKQPRNNTKIVPDIAIVPGLAFSLSGHRLGFGTGYYDKYFAKNKNIITKIGVCFHENLYEYIPYQPHDVKMDYIITDKTIISFCNRSNF
jgi:5-formyltetrahydrofolate cyclo-ligase